MIEILVNGHSGHESTGFSLPNGVSIRFFADPRTTCYVPAMHVANVVQQLRSGGGHLMQPGNIVNDYTIEFNSNEPTEGVFDMQGNKLPDVGNAISLKNLIQGLRQMFNEDIMIYGIFCRGSARESFAGQVAPVSEQVGQQAFLNEEPLDFDMKGGKKKTRKKSQRRRKRKRKLKKRKTRKKRGGVTTIIDGKFIKKGDLVEVVVIRGAGTLKFKGIFIEEGLGPGEQPTFYFHSTYLWHQSKKWVSIRKWSVPIDEIDSINVISNEKGRTGAGGGKKRRRRTRRKKRKSKRR